MLSWLWLVTVPLSYTTYLPVVHQTLPTQRGIIVFQPGDEISLVANWYYDWNYADSDLNDTEFVPMFRPDTIVYANAYSQTYAQRNVLAFNEPDGCPGPDSDCLTVNTLVQDWYTLEHALPNSHLIGPGLTNHCYGDSCWSLADFLDTYHARYGTWPRLDGLAIHYYQYFGYDVTVPDTTLTQTYRRTWPNWLAYMKQTLTDRGYDNIPIWLTEFGYQPLCGHGWSWCPNVTGVTTGLQDWLTLIHSDSQLERYAYFATREQLFTTDQSWWPMSLINPDNTLTPVGEVYRD